MSTKTSKLPLIIKHVTVGQMAVNCYLVIDRLTDEAIIIDPGDDAQYIMSVLGNSQAKPTRIIATHGHFDHIMAAGELQLTYNIPFVVHKLDVFLVKRMQESAAYFLGLTDVDPPPRVMMTIGDNDRIKVGNISLQVLHTPGHTPGSICLHYGQGSVLFVGDLMFAQGGFGRVDFSYSNKKDLDYSLDKVLHFDGHTIVYPGHGASTTVDAEKQYYNSVY